MIQLQSKIRHNKVAFYINQKKVGLYPQGLIFFHSPTLHDAGMIIQVPLHQAADRKTSDLIKRQGNDVRIIKYRFSIDNDMVEPAMDLPVGQLVPIDS